MKEYLTIAFFLLMAFLPLNHVYAQQISLSLYPPLIQATIKPSKSFIIAYTVKNDGDPVFIRPLIRTFSPTGVLGNMTIHADAEGPIQFSLDNSVIKLNEPFFLKSKASEQLLLRIRVPEGAPYGDYYYSLLAQTEQMPGVIGSFGALSTGAIGSTLLISVSETEITQSEPYIERIEVSPRSGFFLLPQYIYDSSDIIGIKVIAGNTGKNSYKAKGQIEVSSTVGKEESFPFIEDNILADSTRLLRASDSAQLDCARNNVKALCKEAPFTSIIQSFTIGRKKISAVLTGNDNTHSSTKSIEVFFFPIKLVLSIIILFGTVVFFNLLFSKKTRPVENTNDPQR